MLFKGSSASSLSENEFQPKELERQTLEYTDRSKRFYEASRDFSKQYAHIYSARLNTFRNILDPVIRKKWSKSYKVLRLCELREKNTTCIIIGTLFKLQELKPSILKELSDELEILPQPSRTHFVHDTDSLVLEDELQRIKLVGDCIDINQVVTGVVCALLVTEMIVVSQDMDSQPDLSLEITQERPSNMQISPEPSPTTSTFRNTNILPNILTTTQPTTSTTPLSIPIPPPSTTSTSTTSFLRHRNSILNKEYQDRFNRASEIHVLEKELLQYKIREAKAKAELAELILQRERLQEGSEDEDGVFTIKDVYWPGCHIQKPLPKLESDRYIVLISGLNMASKSASQMLSLHLLVEWLGGLSGTSQYQEQLSNIVRVIVAGGVFVSHSNEKTLNESDVIASADVVDSFVTAVSAIAPLDLMPGCKDPTGIMLPQKPFHYCLFPKAVEYKSFHRVSNPYECEIGGILCLGTSGEPVKDIKRYSKIENNLDVMKKTLEWRHLAPTCPDTVPCTPCMDTDPFTIYNCPAIYFSGNSGQFETELYEGNEGQKVRLVCVPDFCETKTVAIVNLRNLECYSMMFS